MTENLSYPEVQPINGNADKLVVFIHGLGSDGHDLIGLVPFMQKDLPNCHFISPHGVEAFDMAPFGRQWFSLNDRDPIIVKNLLTQNVPLLAKIIKDKQRQLNLTNKDTVIIGFSQGTMIGLYLNLIQNEPFACMVGFSGRLITPSECINTETPICLIHGQEDDIVNISEMQIIADYLTKYNISHKTYEIPNLAHSIDHRAINLAIEFIKPFIKNNL